MFLAFCLLCFAAACFLLGLLCLAVEMAFCERRVRRIKRLFREAYIDLQKGHATDGDHLALQWHRRLSSLGR